MRMSMESEMDQCIVNCMTCYRACAETKVYCVQKGGKHAAPEHLSLLGDCARICETSADFMIRRSERHGLTCGVCATICEACAADCEQMGEDEQMRQCAEVCRRCAQSCHAMATSMSA